MYLEIFRWKHVTLAFRQEYSTEARATVQGRSPRARGGALCRTVETIARLVGVRVVVEHDPIDRDFGQWAGRCGQSGVADAP